MYFNATMVNKYYLDMLKRSPLLQFQVCLYVIYTLLPTRGSGAEVSLGSHKVHSGSYSTRYVHQLSLPIFIFLFGGWVLMNN